MNIGFVAFALYTKYYRNRTENEFRSCKLKIVYEIFQISNGKQTLGL